jgi:hypothetical protein
LAASERPASVLTLAPWFVAAGVAIGCVETAQHQVRRWRSWYRWMTLAMLAHAFLVVAALTDNTRHPPPPS